MSVLKREPAAQRDDWTRALEDIEYPISIALPRSVMDRGGIDHEVLDVVNRLPEEDFESEEQLLAVVRAIYAEDDLTSPI